MSPSYTQFALERYNQGISSCSSNSSTKSAISFATASFSSFIGHSLHSPSFAASDEGVMRLF
jgi:hypothetical protein